MGKGEGGGDAHAQDLLSKQTSGPLGDSMSAAPRPKE